MLTGKSSHELIHASCQVFRYLVCRRTRIGTDRPGGRRFDRHRWNGGSGDFFDPRRRGARRRQCHVAGICYRRSRGALVHLFVRQARRHVSLSRRRRAFLGEELWRWRPRRWAEPVHVGGLHHFAGFVCHGLRRLRRHLCHHHVVPVLVLTLVNAFGATLMGRWETVIVVVKVAILVLFAAVGLCFIRPGYLSPELWPETKSILFGAGVLFIGYEGFGLITNAAADMRDPRKLLPRALYTSVILVIALYLAVSLTVTGNLSDYEIEQAKDYALAEAAKPFLGQFGFRLIAIAALFSTASAINATLFGSANVCYMIARDGELPAGLSRTEWKDATGGLLLTAALVVLVTLSFDLSGIAMMGSAAFLLVYAAVNAGHLNVLRETGASAIIVWLSLLTCLAMFAVLSVYTWQQQPAAIAALAVFAAGSFAAEWGYRRWTGRKIKDSG